jgi:hypothetical protein
VYVQFVRVRFSGINKRPNLVLQKTITHHQRERSTQQTNEKPANQVFVAVKGAKRKREEREGKEG